MSLSNEECKRILNILPNYSVGIGSDKGKALIQAHLDNCPECRSELLALEKVGEMLAQVEMEAAPDLWESIKPNLAPRANKRVHARIAEWIGRYRLQSAAAAVTAVGLAVIMLIGTKPESQIQAESYMNNHMSMSWREPFTDKAGLGLAGAILEVDSEESW